MADPTNLNNTSPGAFRQGVQPVENPLTPAVTNPPNAASNNAPVVTGSAVASQPQQLGGGVNSVPTILGDAMGLCCGGATIINQSGGGGSSGGGFSSVTTVQTANYNAAVGELVQVDPSGGDFDVTLPSAATAGAGKQVGISFASDDGGFVTMDNTGGDTINGQPSGTFQYTSPPRAFVTFVSDGVSNWMIQG